MAEIVVKNALSELERVSAIVDRFGAEHGLGAPAVFAANLALDEVLTNVILYAYEDAAGHEIRIRLSLRDGQLVVQVEDDGRPFNPLDVAAADLDQPLNERPIGGLGIHLVRHVMDGSEYTRLAGKNVLVMRKKAGPA